jgi:hypothetical protein
MSKFLGFLILTALQTAFGAVDLKIEKIDGHKTLVASGPSYDIRTGQVLAVKSQSSGDFIAFVRATSVERVNSEMTVKAEVVRGSQYNFVRVGDTLLDFDLSTAAADYQGSTELLVRNFAPETSARFKPLFTQGVSIGETAQTLWKGEYLFTLTGLLYYGASDWLTVGTWIPGDATRAPNLSFKTRFTNTSAVAASTGFSFARDPQNSKNWLVNLNLMADFFTTEETVSHIFATLAVYSIEEAEDTTAIKSAGTSSFQSGYEFILDSWNRILAGPNYNFETKTVGGYLSYVRIWDRFHLQGTLYSVNVQNVKWSLTEGYFAYVDAYWRF